MPSPPGLHDQGGRRRRGERHREAGDRGAGDAQVSPSGCRGHRPEECPGCGAAARGRRTFTQLPAKPTRKRGKCKWLASAGGSFGGRKPHKKVCDSPVWLAVKGTRHWHLGFHGLPPGNYMLYSRAVGAGGVAEGHFSSADKNRRMFPVPMRRLGIIALMGALALLLLAPAGASAAPGSIPSGPCRRSR